MDRQSNQPTIIADPSYQYSLFDDSKTEAIVNVASVPQRSPFRYPGGKTWLIPRLRQWLASRTPKPTWFIEPFAGGGTMSLTAAFERLSDRVIMVELDAEVAAVWQTILEGDAVWLANGIAQFAMSHESVQAALTSDASDRRSVAFRTLLRNRINHGGILAPGSGRIKHGENGKGLMSRWYPQTLRKRIEGIASVAGRIQFVHGDGLQVLRDHAHCPDAVFFIDPPYTAAGKRAGSRLYTHNELDHDELFRTASTLCGDFLMTYDNADGVHDLAKKHGFDTRAISMKSTHHAEMTELLIGRDLKWVR